MGTLGFEPKGRYRSMATHGPDPTAEDLITIALFDNYPGLANEYWTQVEVSDGHELGRIDILFQPEAGAYIVVEVKSSASRIDEAIGQVLRYSFLFAKQLGCSDTDLQKWVVAPSFYPSHIHICKQLGIRLIVIKPVYLPKLRKLHKKSR